MNKVTKLTKVLRKGKKVAPQLRISGRFLEENGFKPKLRSLVTYHTLYLNPS